MGCGCIGKGETGSRASPDKFIGSLQIIVQGYGTSFFLVLSSFSGDNETKIYGLYTQQIILQGNDTFFMGLSFYSGENITITDLKQYAHGMKALPCVINFLHPKLDYG